MKKIIAIVLALALVLSCTAALAAQVTTAGWSTPEEGTNMNVKTSGAGNFRVDDIDKPTKAEQKTALWLQVEASGQINCTIPLALVYKTNIDGGNAATANNYKIINNSTANLGVIEIKVDVKDTTNTTLKKGVDYASALDTYKGSLTVSGTYTLDGGNCVKDLGDVYAAGSHKITTTSAAPFFVIKKASSGANSTPIAMGITTGPLSFVTKAADGTGESAKEYGIHLLDVTYVVAINTNEAKGSEVKELNINVTDYERSSGQQQTTSSYNSFGSVHTPSDLAN